MNIRIQIVVAIVVVVALSIIINMIRRKRLELRYALSWLLVGVSILILDCFPQLITWLAVQLGIASPINMLFFFGFCFSLVIILLFLTLVIRQHGGNICKPPKTRSMDTQNSIDFSFYTFFPT